MNRTLVIGGSSNVGRQVLSQLAPAETQVRALSRDPSAAVYGDLTIPETLDTPLDGIDSVFLLWTAPASAVAPAIERIAKRVRRIVFLSSPYKTPHPMFQRPQPNAISSLHAEIERLIVASGCEWTFLRPGMFASNAKLWWSQQIRAGDVVRWPYPHAPTAPIHEHDIAAVAVRALSEAGHAGQEYLLTGPESLTQSEQVATIGKVIGRPVRMEGISPDEAREEFSATWPIPVLDMLLKAWAGAMEAPALVTSTVAELTGRPARTFLDWATENAEDFRVTRSDRIVGQN